jgi:hypothetical protein
MNALPDHWMYQLFSRHSFGVLLYLDPGSGSTIIQLLVAGLFASLFFIKVYWKKITGFIKRPKDSQPEDQSDDGEG